MNNKAFTLIELLGVLIIISIISILVFPAVSNIINESKDTIYQAQINAILKSAYDFSIKNTSYLPSVGEKKFVTLAELKINGLIDIDIKDPITEQKFRDDLVISIEKVGTNYNYDKKVSKLEGSYLYKVELDNHDDSSLLPVITLNGLTKNSDGNYILILDLNDEFNAISYTATSNSGKNLTNRVKTYITVDDIATDEIDTSESNIYKMYYIVVDNEGYSNMSILSIIIADTTKPIISLPSNNKISTSVSSMDLLDGVTCEDNSGYCDISVSDSINYGTPGKYIVEYTATDPSGNTTTSRRVITIE